MWSLILSLSHQGFFDSHHWRLFCRLAFKTCRKNSSGVSNIKCVNSVISLKLFTPMNRDGTSLGSGLMARVEIFTRWVALILKLDRALCFKIELSLKNQASGQALPENICDSYESSGSWLKLDLGSNTMLGLKKIPLAPPLTYPATKRRVQKSPNFYKKQPNRQ